MVTRANYTQKVNQGILSTNALKQGHSFMNDYAKFYGKDKTISEAIDNHIKLVNIALTNSEKETKAPAKTTDKKVTAKPKAPRAPKAPAKRKAVAKAKTATKAKTVAPRKPVVKPLVHRTIKSPELTAITRFLNLPKVIRTRNSIELFHKQVHNANKLGKYVDHPTLMDDVNSSLSKVITAMNTANTDKSKVVLSPELADRCRNAIAKAKEKLRVSYLGGLKTSDKPYVDLGDIYSNLPKKVKNILDTFDEDKDEYKEAKRIVNALNKIGWTAEYYLDGLVYNVGEIGKDPFGWSGKP
jgi:hypothetical protein